LDADSNLPIEVLRLDHTAIAVRDLDSALPLYRDVLGGTQIVLAENTREGFWVTQLRYPNGVKIELLEPTGDGSLAKFLAKRGEGVHHITFYVADLRAAVEQARQAGLRVVGENYANPRAQQAFISPTSASGALVQLEQVADLEQKPVDLEHLRGAIEVRRERLRKSTA
jgi:methylmalonyl-CoA/ethylmalonyl-CoA epimerase